MVRLLNFVINEHIFIDLQAIQKNIEDTISFPMILGSILDVSMQKYICLGSLSNDYPVDQFLTFIDLQ